MQLTSTLSGFLQRVDIVFQQRLALGVYTSSNWRAHLQQLLAFEGELVGFCFVSFLSPFLIWKGELQLWSKWPRLIFTINQRRSDSALHRHSPLFTSVQLVHVVPKPSFISISSAAHRDALKRFKLTDAGCCSDLQTPEMLGC